MSHAVALDLHVLLNLFSYCLSHVCHSFTCLRMSRVRTTKNGDRITLCR